MNARDFTLARTLVATRIEQAADPSSRAAKKRAPADVAVGRA
jgi:hypothetical protein